MVQTPVSCKSEFYRPKDNLNLPAFNVDITHFLDDISIFRSPVWSGELDIVWPKLFLRMLIIKSLFLFLHQENPNTKHIVWVIVTLSPDQKIFITQTWTMLNLIIFVLIGHTKKTSFINESSAFVKSCGRGCGGS